MNFLKIFLLFLICAKSFCATSDFDKVEIEISGGESTSYTLERYIYEINDKNNLTYINQGTSSILAKYNIKLNEANLELIQQLTTESFSVNQRTVTLIPGELLTSITFYKNSKLIKKIILSEALKNLQNSVEKISNLKLIKSKSHQ